jgi:glycerophosphoryl diester phosphodiesterase
MGVSYLELDVRMTCDGHVIVLHDPSIDRTTDGSGIAAQMTLRELKRLDAGYRFRPEKRSGFPYRGRGVRIPTLEEVLASCPPVFINIEVKQSEPAMEEALEAVLERCDALPRVLLASKRLEILERIRRRFGDRVATGISHEEGVRFARWFILGRRRGPRLRGQALQIPETFAGIRYINESLVQAAHDAGLEVHVWTVNDPRRMHKYLEMGVDGIMTDFPDLFFGLKARGERQKGRLDRMVLRHRNLGS